MKHEDELPYSRCGPALLSRRDNSSNTGTDVSKLALVRVANRMVSHSPRRSPWAALAASLLPRCGRSSCVAKPFHTACQMSCGVLPVLPVCVCPNGLFGTLLPCVTHQAATGMPSLYRSKGRTLSGSACCLRALMSEMYCRTLFGAILTRCCRSNIQWIASSGFLLKQNRSKSVKQKRRDKHGENRCRGKFDYLH